MIFEILPRGAENAITARDLLKLSGMPSGAALRHQIALERRTGSLILSTCRGKRRGYFCPSNDPATAQDELAAFVAQMNSRAKKIIIATLGAREAINDIEQARNDF